MFTILHLYACEAFLVDTWDVVEQYSKIIARSQAKLPFHRLSYNPQQVFFFQQYRYTEKKYTTESVFQMHNFHRPQQASLHLSILGWLGCDFSWLCYVK